MTDQEFREIQLTAKQLFFLFMSAVVVAVVIFLLGVSVGRGVGEPVSAAADTSTVTDTVVSASAPGSTPAPPPPATTYDQKLQGQSVPPPSAEPVPPPPSETKPAADATTPPAATAQDTPAASADKPAATPDRAAAPASARTTAGEVPPIKPEPNKSVPPAPSGLALQVGAFSSRENAETLVGTLKSKGYPAFMVAQAQSKTFAVRVGPFASRAESDKTAARLTREEGMKPLVIAR